ncbi:MAG: hypothetical protein IPK13_18685 [Deltaproteobacteria bacterium]|nr:hypothetical protein [Deltaproteobacteria bacterium]
MSESPPRIRVEQAWRPRAGLKLWILPLLGTGLTAAQPAPTSTSTSTSTSEAATATAVQATRANALSSEDRELARWLDVVDNWSLFEELEFLEVMPALEEDDD